MQQQSEINSNCNLQLAWKNFSETSRWCVLFVIDLMGKSRRFGERLSYSCPDIKFLVHHCDTRDSILSNKFAIFSVVIVRLVPFEIPSHLVVLVTRTISGIIIPGMDSDIRHSTVYHTGMCFWSHNNNNLKSFLAQVLVVESITWKYCRFCLSSRICGVTISIHQP